VNLIAGKASTVPYYLYREVGQPNDEEFDRILQHPAIKLLKRPNKYMTGRRLRAITHMHLDLCGFAVWLKIRNAVGKVKELYPLNPHELVTIEKGNNTDELIKKFVFSSTQHQQTRQEYSWDDVVYFNYPHPTNVMMPFTPMQACCHVTDLDMLMQVYEKDFFQNNARPDFVIVAEDPIQEQEANAIHASWSAKHRGPGKQHKPAILSKNVRIEQLGMSARDFEFLGLSEWIKDNILAAYNVPEAMLGLYESFNKSSSVTAETTFVKNCIDPRLRLIEDTINLQLLPDFGENDGLEFKHESALPKDDEWELAKDQAEVNMAVVSPNEIRKRKGLKPWDTPLADIAWMNGEPVPGQDKEADELWSEKIMGSMGMGAGQQGAMPQDPNAMAQQGGGVAPQQMPAAQGAMGQMGGRPPLPALQQLVAEAARSSKPGLSSLLNAARGNQQGLAKLIAADPSGSLQSMLDSGKYDQSLTKLITRGLHDYIADNYFDDPIDKIVFKAYEESYDLWNKIETDYTDIAKGFLVDVGDAAVDIVEKGFSDYVTKDPAEDLTVDWLKGLYEDQAEPYINKAAEVGVGVGVYMVQKGTGDDAQTISDPQRAAEQAAGKFLDLSSDLRAKSIQTELTKIIKKAISTGMDLEEVVEIIKKRFSHIGSTRATMIARTEIAGAMNEGAMTSFETINKQAGKPVVKRILHWTSLDDRVCEDPNPAKNCDRAHGRVIKDFANDQVYYKTATLHPNCRCGVKPEF
jgi:HK97 family phage portal protein